MVSARGVGSYGVRTVLFLIFLLGCARVNIQSDKPIKVDVTMRLDIYQHVTQDVASIEDMISPPKDEKAAGPGKTSLLSWGVTEAYAEEESGYPADVQAAIERRKARRPELSAQETLGIIGENAKGFVEIRDESLSNVKTPVLVEEENRDRQMIYQYVAKKNGAGFEETAKIFSRRIQADAPKGTPIEALDGSGTLKWVRK